MDLVASGILFAVLFALSAFFSGSEIALMSLPVHKIESLVKQKKSGAKTLKKLKEKNESLLITILIGNNLVNVLTASLATKISLDIANASGLEQSLAIGISTGVITLLLLLFGEIFPKTLATRYAEKIALWVAKIYQILWYVFFPVIVAIEGLMKLLHNGKDPDIEITDEEIESFIDMGKESGLFEQGEHEKLKKMLDFYEVEAHEIMTPRIKVEALDAALTVQEALEIAVHYSHSRLPVYVQNIDNVQRIVTLRELVELEVAGKKDVLLSELKLKEAIRIPIAKPIHKALELMRKRRIHIAIVMDEYGGVAGLLTLEDIMEEVFGDFKDESDLEETPIKKVEDQFIVQWFVRVDDVMESLDIEFEHIGLEEAEYEGETISYFLTTYLERFPKVWEKISFNIFQEDCTIEEVLEIEVKSVDEKTVSEVAVQRK